MFKNKEIRAEAEENEKNKILNIHEMIKDYNQTLQKFLINQKDNYSGINVLNNKNDYFSSGGGNEVNETKNTEIADIYLDLNINTNQAANKNLNMENLNSLILGLIGSHSILDENLDELLVKLESQVNSMK